MVDAATKSSGGLERFLSNRVLLAGISGWLVLNLVALYLAAGLFGNL
jgi:hypothetical protein